MTEDRPPVIVVGAGMGGLAAALTLAARGVPVTVIERTSTAGGKVRTLRVQGRAVDAGPTVFTLRSVFDTLFADLGLSFDDAVRLTPLDRLARHYWGDEGPLDLFADVDRSAAAVEAFSGPRDARGLRRFAARARRIFETLDESFMRAPAPSLSGLIRASGVAGLGDLAAIKPFVSLWRSLGEDFTDPRLRQLFGRFATYCGSSPFAAPATLMLVAHAEQQGVWSVDGGMAALPEALAATARSRGVTFRFDTEVTAIERDARGVGGVRLRTHDGAEDRLAAGYVIVNGDVAALGGGLFGDGVKKAVAAPDPSRRSLSAVTWAMHTQTGGFPLVRHNVFFSDDYAREFDEIFQRHSLPRDPTVYICAQDRDGEGRRLDGAANGAPERLLCLINAPPVGDRRTFAQGDIDGAFERMARRLARSGLALAPAAGETVATAPDGFHALFPGTGGALYGRASHGWRASFERPGVRTAVPGLYVAGGSAHPGPGVPMAALSGRLAALALVEDRHDAR